MTPDALVTDDLIAFHREVAAGGVAISTVAYCAVTPAGAPTVTRSGCARGRAGSGPPDRCDSQRRSAGRRADRSRRPRRELGVESGPRAGGLAHPAPMGMSVTQSPMPTDRRPRRGVRRCGQARRRCRVRRPRITLRPQLSAVGFSRRCSAAGAMATAAPGQPRPIRPRGWPRRSPQPSATRSQSGQS